MTELNMTELKLDSVCVDLGGTELISQLALTLRPGEKVGILGPSGSGKSLTALTIMGLLPHHAATKGYCTLGDKELLQLDDQAMSALRGRHIAMIFQEPMTALNPLMTIGKQIGEVFWLHDIKPKSKTRRIAELLAQVGLLPTHAKSLPHELSGGQRQRAMIAMALAGEPKILIADEPTSALDSVHQRSLLDLIKTLCADTQMSLILISHDIGAVKYVCDRALIMDQGQIVETGDLETIFTTPQSLAAKELIGANTYPNLSVAQKPATNNADAENVVEIKDLSFAYPAKGLARLFNPPPLILNQVNLTLLQADILGIAGSSGSGKTTLGRILTGLEKPLDGELHILGQHVKQGWPAELRRDVSMVFQDPYSSLDPSHTIADILKEPLLELKLDAAETAKKIATALDEVRLPKQSLGRYPHQFSGGQRQRIALARALITKPKLIVLDEPTSALDAHLREQMLALLLELKTQHRLTYVFITHDIELLRLFASEIAVMDKGKIVEIGAPSTLLHAPTHPATRALIDAIL